jgi:hypothetical protein
MNGRLRRASRFCASLLPLLLFSAHVVARAATNASRTATSSGTIITGFPVVAQAWALSCEYAATSAATAY